MVPPAGPAVAERYATRSVARAPAADDRTAELEAAVEYYKDVVLPDYRDAKSAYEKRMILHRAFDANLYELIIKNVTLSVIERLTRDYHGSYLSASSPASGIAFARLLLSSLKPTPHEKHLAQRDLFSQLEGLKQGKDVTMESHLHAFKTCHQRLLDLDYVLDEGAAIPSSVTSSKPSVYKSQWIHLQSRTVMPLELPNKSASSNPVRADLLAMESTWRTALLLPLAAREKLKDATGRATAMPVAPSRPLARCPSLLADDLQHQIGVLRPPVSQARRPVVRSYG